MGKGKKVEKEFILDEHLIRPELEQKGSKRSLQIRRALEDREEDKRLSAIFGEDYWEGI
ncbi:PA3496 family putative envelope integrity protein [Endozoicomonas sp. YOMI1]|uniref:PA3496 family putative envelope integrity protein n=1 Tax=Endozoicomonas sp. YOMI1 TaxID=2828739 RepID=UPI0021473340|nr:hypothetical protein [Endozoicomonas sp. YOMI1]